MPPYPKLAKPERLAKKNYRWSLGNVKRIYGSNFSKKKILTATNSNKSVSVLYSNFKFFGNPKSLFCPAQYSIIPAVSQDIETS